MMVSPTSEVADFQQRRYFPALDGMRAVSVLMVMSNHLHSNFSLMRRTPGWAGVDVFCVLSGFLITTLLLREEEKSGSVRLRAFYLRRFFRIVPVFFFVLLLYVPVAYFGERGVRWPAFKTAIPLYSTFMQDFVPHEAPFSFSWTLGIEEKFYLIWPLFAFILLKGLGKRIALATLFLCLSATLYLWLEGSSDRAFYQARSYAALALGSLLACLLASKIVLFLSRILESVPSVIPFLSVVLSLALVYYDRKFILLLDAAIIFLLCHLLLVSSPGREWLSNPVLVWIGKRSYSMYLIHLLVLNPIRVALNPKSFPSELMVLAFAYSLTAGIAHLIYLFLEQPMRKLGKRISDPYGIPSKSSDTMLQTTG